MVGGVGWQGAASGNKQAGRVQGGSPLPCSAAPSPRMQHVGMRMAVLFLYVKAELLILLHGDTDFAFHFRYFTFSRRRRRRADSQPRHYDNRN